MVRFLLPLVVGLVALAGCGSKPTEEAQPGPAKPPVEETKTPAELLHEQLRSGSFQLTAALDSIEAALKEAKAHPATGELKNSLKEIADDIDSAGTDLTEENDDPPTKEQVAADMASFEAKRKKLCDMINDSLHDLIDARGIVDSFAEEGKTGPLENVGLKIDVAIDDLKGALEALGGKEESEEGN